VAVSRLSVVVVRGAAAVIQAETRAARRPDCGINYGSRRRRRRSRSRWRCLLVCLVGVVATASPGSNSANAGFSSPSTDRPTDRQHAILVAGKWGGYE